MDIVICVFFATEVGLRLTAHGFKFFYMRLASPGRDGLVRLRLGWGWNAWSLVKMDEHGDVRAKNERRSWISSWCWPRL